MSAQTETENVATQVINAMQEGEQAALGAVQQFVQAVDEALPVLPDEEEGPARRKVIDSAFRMVDELIASSNDFARNIVAASERTLEASGKDAKS